MNKIFYINKYLKDNNKLLVNNYPFVKFENNILIFQQLNFYKVLKLEIYQNHLYIEFLSDDKIDEEDNKISYEYKISNLCENYKDENRISEKDIIEFKDIIKISFINCILNNTFIDKKSNIKNIIFNDCEIKGEFSVQDNKNDMELSFISTTIENGAYFQRSKFDTVKLKTTTFKKFVSFDQCEFDNIILDYVTFDGNVYFQNAIINGNLDLKYIIFTENVNFLNLKFNELNRETARIIKHSFEKLDNIIEANKFYALEMEKREEELKDKDNQDYNLIDWIVFKFHKLSSNHSQDWVLALLWIINIGFIASFMDFFSKTICNYYINITSWNLVYITVLLIYLLFAIVITKNNINLTIKIIPMLLYVGYSLITHDIFLSDYAKVLNPFSIMNGNDNINIVQLFFKIVIAYLIYQFIISIRQNTRRK